MVSLLSSIAWFKIHPAIRFQSATSELNFAETMANVLVAAVVAMLAVVAISSIGRASGLWKD